MITVLTPIRFKTFLISLNCLLKYLRIDLRLLSDFDENNSLILTALYGF